MDGKVVIGTELDTKSFDAQIKQVERELEILEKSADESNIPEQFRRSEDEAKQLQAEIEKTKNKLISLYDKRESLIPPENEKWNDIEKKNKNINDGLSKTIKKVTKWALAVFGVRSAYSAIRSAMSVISQYDDKLASNIDYIKYALAYTLKPIIEWLINALVKILQYVNYIYKAWTGKNLFKTADAFKKAQKNAKGLNKELNKTSASFDEINTLSSQKDTGGGVSAPSVDLTELPEGDIPKWVEGIKNFGLWVKDNWKTIIGILLGIGAVIVLFKLFSKTTKEMVPSITEGANAFLKMAGLAVILGAFALILHEMANLIDVFANSGLKLTDVIGLMATVLGTIIILMSSVALLGPAMTAGMVPFLAIIGGVSAILLVMAATLPIILEAVGNFITQTAPSLQMILETIGKLIQDIILALGTTLPPIIKQIGNVFGTIFNGIAKVIKTVGDVIVNIMTTADRLVNSVLQSIIRFINQLGPAINNFVDGAIRAVTKLINFVVSGIEYLINTLIINALNHLIATVNKIPLVDVPTIPRVSIARFRPRLAKGGIINQPGRGVPVGYGQAIGGEKGQEGVIPLTDSQQMQLLGEAIGKYIRIDNVIDVNMDSRRINRILQSSSDRLNFANNR